MSKFFANFPKNPYTMPGQSSTVIATNIFKRFRPVPSVLTNISIYYTYDIIDGDKPEIVSQKFYESVDYDWVILMFNEMLDPYFSWPLSSREMETFLEKKYGSFRNATQTIHHYEWIIQPRTVLDDGTIIDERTLVVDKTNYDALSATERKKVYCYDYELNLNESKRTIKVPNERYLPQIDLEKAKIFG